MTGFEPAASSSRTKRATGLRYIPNLNANLTHESRYRKYIKDLYMINDHH